MWFPINTSTKPLNEWQYQSFVKGSEADWDFRYATRNIGGWHYITRSGHFVKKFRYELKEDRLYHITEHYSSEKEKGRDLILEMLHYGRFTPQIYTK